MAASRMEHFSVVSSFTNGFRGGFDLSTSSVVMGGGGGGSAASCDLSFSGLNKPEKSTCS